MNNKQVSIRSRKANVDTWAMYASHLHVYSYGSICWLLFGSEPNNSKQIDA